MRHLEDQLNFCGAKAESAAKASIEDARKAADAADAIATADKSSGLYKYAAAWRKFADAVAVALGKLAGSIDGSD